MPYIITNGYKPLLKYDLIRCLFQLVYAGDFVHVMECNNIFIKEKQAFSPCISQPLVAVLLKCSV